MSKILEIKKSFDFLLEYGFKRKTYDNGIDCECCYKKAGVEIDIDYLVVVDQKIIEAYNKIDYNLCKNIIHVIVEKNGVRTSIFNSPLYEKELLDVLSKNIACAYGQPKRELEIYSDFIKNNLINLL